MPYSMKHSPIVSLSKSKWAIFYNIWASWQHLRNPDHTISRVTSCIFAESVRCNKEQWVSLTEIITSIFMLPKVDTKIYNAFKRIVSTCMNDTATWRATSANSLTLVWFSWTFIVRFAEDSCTGAIDKLNCHTFKRSVFELMPMSFVTQITVTKYAELI